MDYNFEDENDKVGEVMLVEQLTKLPFSRAHRPLKEQVEEAELEYNSANQQHNLELELARIKHIRKKYKTLFQLYSKRAAVYSCVFDRRPQIQIEQNFAGARIYAQNILFYYNRFAQRDQKKQLRGIRFDAKFECGNIHSVYSTGRNQFDLLVRNDINTQLFSSWFYFRIAKIDNKPIKLNIIAHNIPPDTNQVWVKGCKTIKNWVSRKFKARLQNTQILKNQPRSKLCFYKVLRLEIDNAEGQPSLEIALSKPYGYSHLCKFLKQFASKQYQPFVKIISLTHSVLGLPLLCLELRLPESETDKKRRNFVIIARQNAAETESSRFVEHIITAIINKKQLHEQFNFLIIPMVNIEGVVFGNSSCDLGGNVIQNCWNNLKCPLVNIIKAKISELQSYDIVIEVRSSHSLRANKFVIFNNPEPLIIFSALKETVPEFKESTIELVEQNNNKTGFHYFIENSGYYKNVQSVCVVVPQCHGNYITPEVVLFSMGALANQSKKIMDSINVYDKEDLEIDNPDYQLWKNIKKCKEVLYMGVQIKVKVYDDQQQQNESIQNKSDAEPLPSESKYESQPHQSYAVNAQSNQSLSCSKNGSDAILSAIKIQRIKDQTVSKQSQIKRKKRQATLKKTEEQASLALNLNKLKKKNSQRNNKLKKTSLKLQPMQFNQNRIKVQKIQGVKTEVMTLCDFDSIMQKVNGKSKAFNKLSVNFIQNIKDESCRSQRTIQKRSGDKLSNFTSLSFRDPKSEFTTSHLPSFSNFGVQKVKKIKKAVRFGALFREVEEGRKKDLADRAVKFASLNKSRKKTDFSIKKEQVHVIEVEDSQCQELPFKLRRRLVRPKSCIPI